MHHVSRYQDWYQKEDRMRCKGREGTISLLHRNGFHNIIRGGEITSNNDDLISEKHSSDTMYRKRIEPIRKDAVFSQSTITSIGVIDLSGTGSNIASMNSSIILLVYGETTAGDVTVDETLLRTNLLPLFEEKSKHVSIGASVDNINIIFESFALMCDVLVLRISDEEILEPDLMSHVIRGNRQRELAGMAAVKLWLCATTGPGHGLQRVSFKNYINGYDDDQCKSGDDQRCGSETTTWSVLFSPSNDKSRNKEQENEPPVPSPEELFASFSQQVIEFKLRSILQSDETSTTKLSSESAFLESSPKVYVVYRSKHPSVSVKMEKKAIETRMQSASINTERSDENLIRATDEDHGNEETIGDIIGMAYRRLEGLEEKMQELVLDESLNPMPLLEFGDVLQNILQTMETQLRNARAIPHSFRKGAMKRIIIEVERLYKDQLQALRNYYGQRYESILDEDLENTTDDNETIERKWAIGAEHLTQAFLAAALNSIPAMYRIDSKENNNDIGYRSEASFDHVDMLQGLIHDMMESTERRKDERNLAIMLVSKEDQDSTESASTFIRLPKIPKWLERLAARAFVFGVNYIQGWLAWQGIKRAAIERDRNQPKFPLF
eukprot:CAMPEP_0197193790 /NCGR_PEP_ID=MMETSP1423-20130617/27999_1 /TAXON_ID=476441 /ORGANISM="Pseudo-nitzschia heimii, Strain UNC1101" /LENGTH=609 /DNA_ID=CAMNT_0042647083 /DNA_START=173 /DNA_END=2002 /DNA_ORIENTATION=-